MAQFEEELKKMPTAPQVETEMHKHFGVIQTLVEKLDGGARKKDYDDSGFHHKDASDHKPGVWAGKKDKVEFPEFASALKNWADA